VIVLKMIEGYSHEEIGVLLGITPRASEQRLHRAVKILRAQFTSSSSR
jgi:DNA-directed RNA polymerase specialized sigma24 family protein